VCGCGWDLSLFCPSTTHLNSHNKFKRWIGLIECSFYFNAILTFCSSTTCFSVQLNLSKFESNRSNSSSSWRFDSFWFCCN
jgi:hypothetical protein